MKLHKYCPRCRMEHHTEKFILNGEELPLCRVCTMASEKWKKKEEVGEAPKDARVRQAIPYYLLRGIKVCRICQIEQPLENFYSDGKLKSSYCKKCISEKRKKTRKKKGQLSFDFMMEV